VSKSWEVIKMYQTLQRSSSQAVRSQNPPTRKGKGKGPQPSAGAGGSGRSEGAAAGDGAAEEGGGVKGAGSAVDAQRGVMEELAGKSAYVRQIEMDRQKMRPMITDLCEQINAFKPLDMLQIDVFVAEVERRLALLSDERMVLRAFTAWPEKKLEAMREAVARKAELEKLTRSLDPHGDKWQARNSIADELQQAMDRFNDARPKIEWYMRESEAIRKNLRAQGVPFDMDLVKGAQHAPLGLAKYGMRMLATAHSRMLEAAPADAAAALPTIKELISQVLKFAFQCHQFSGGFDAEANHLFGDLHAIVAPPEQ